MKAKMVEVQELLSDDLELLHREIDEFCAAIAKGIEQNIPETVENYLLYVARTGNIVFPWTSIRPLFRFKLKSAIEQFQGEPSTYEPSVYERFDTFRSAPFTIQRLSELITQPNRHYKIKDKFVSALEKTVFVVSTIEPKLPHENDNCTNGSEENNTSSSDDGLTQDMNISFDGIQHNDYNNAIGIELPSMSMNNSENEAMMKVESESDGSAPVAVDANFDNSLNSAPASVDTAQPTSTAENNGFISESAALIHQGHDPMSFQTAQNNIYNSDDALSDQVPSAMNIDNAGISDMVTPTIAEMEAADAATPNTSNAQPPSDSSSCTIEPATFDQPQATEQPSEATTVPDHNFASTSSLDEEPPTKTARTEPVATESEPITTPVPVESGSDGDVVPDTSAPSVPDLPESTYSTS